MYKKERKNRRHVNAQSMLRLPSVLEYTISFQKISGYPGVIGAVDGCHIQISKPAEYANSYINRHGYYSINLQGICDTERRFTDVFAGCCGSVHDSTVISKVISSMKVVVIMMTIFPMKLTYWEIKHTGRSSILCQLTKKSVSWQKCKGITTWYTAKLDQL